MAVLDVSPDTKELAWELMQEKPDVHRIQWLIQDCQADLPVALKQAKLEESALLKNPLFRPLHKFFHSSPAPASARPHHNR